MHHTGQRCSQITDKLDKEASSLMGRLNYQLILNLRFKGRGANFFKINIFM